ncbi:MAG: hypothetical protein OEW78_04415 [Nitrosopumilus sp.]|uniref:hypothetical protein n=1 Tax=Nitrosopumilus sp. TaxID=2024843 RepID=UPI002472480D|nr:hypothetical protein [Nitrosopumilus sp.]MDH5431110.1 hypothetical protein [Nitrosopumilus sp.]
MTHNSESGYVWLKERFGNNDLLLGFENNEIICFHPNCTTMLFTSSSNCSHVKYAYTEKSIQKLFFKKFKIKIPDDLNETAKKEYEKWNNTS